MIKQALSTFAMWARLMPGAKAAGQGFWRHQIETQMFIAAPAQQVWTLLMDFERYPQWNPFIRHIEGRSERGEKLRVRVQPVGGRVILFEPEVLAVKSSEEFRWKGRFIVTGLFDGEHYFLLRKEGDHGVVLTHGERFSGLLVPFFRSRLNSETKSGFESMNEALRQMVMTSVEPQ